MSPIDSPQAIGELPPCRKSISNLLPVILGWLSHETILEAQPYSLAGEMYALPGSFEANTICPCYSAYVVPCCQVTQGYRQSLSGLQGLAVERQPDQVGSYEAEEPIKKLRRHSEVFVKESLISLSFAEHSCVVKSVTSCRRHSSHPQTLPLPTLPSLSSPLQ